MRQKTLAELARVDAATAKAQERTALTLVLENLRSGGNVGSIFRTADAFSLARLVLVGITPQPPHREILKTSLGAEAAVPWAYYPTVEEALDALRQNGARVLALEQTTESRDLHTLHPSEGPSGSEPLALVVGNEVRGVTQAALDLCDGAVEIAQYGLKHSLNVSVAAGIVAYWAASSRSRL